MTPKVSFTENTHDTHQQQAFEQLAMHRTKVALARWTSGNTYAEMEVEKALRPTSQTQWYSKAHANFISWLATGGFAAETACPACE